MLNPLEKLYKFCPNCKTTLIKKIIDKKLRIICPNCTFIFWNNPRPCVSAIIFDEDRNILLLKKTNKPFKEFWCLPGGVVEYDETPQQSIIREVKEETNLDIKIKKLIGVYLINNDPRGNGLDLIFIGAVKKAEVILSFEHTEYNFFSPSELPELIAYKHREAISDYEKST